MPVIKKTTKFTKVIKKPDGFVAFAISAGGFIKEHKKEITVFFLAGILVVAVWGGVTTYSKHKLSSDSLKLARITDVLQSNNQGAGDNYKGVENDLDALIKRYSGTLLGVRAGVLRAKIHEKKGDYLSAGMLLELLATTWTGVDEIKKMLLMDSARYFILAKEYDRAINIYDELFKIPENEKDETIYIKKAEALKNAGKQEELKKFIDVSLGKIHDEPAKMRLMELHKSSQGSGH